MRYLIKEKKQIHLKKNLQPRQKITFFSYEIPKYEHKRTFNDFYKI